MKKDGEREYEGKGKVLLPKEPHSASRTVRSKCAICGHAMHLLHESVPDFLFHQPGSWTIVRCSDPACRHAQIDDMPSDDELTILYSNYITHSPAGAEGPGRKDPLTRYLKSRPGHRAREFSFLNSREPGKVLEIGCGNGVNLIKLRDLGWQVAGQDLDPEAAGQARMRGIDVKVGFLSEVDNHLNSYDAIIMIHVIEHLRRPQVELEICSRHLGAGGELVIVTPNIASFTHKLFGRYWAPLHSPYHLQLFTRASVQNAARHSRLNVKSCTTHSTHAASNIRSSLEFMAQEKPWFAKLLKLGPAKKIMESVIFGLLGLAHLFSGDAGDECVLICQTGGY